MWGGKGAAGRLWGGRREAVGGSGEAVGGQYAGSTEIDNNEALGRQ